MARNKKEKLLFYVTCIMLLSLIVFIFGECQLRPIIKQAGANALKNELTLLLNQGVNETIKKEKAHYGDFVNITYSESGAIASISADTIFVNSFKARLSENIAKIVADGGDFNVIVPWGTLFGSEIFSDRGFELTVESSTYGFAIADVLSSFDSVGINQTLHKIYVEVELSASAYIGNYKVSETVKGSVPVAETVIIGSVPNAYYSHN